MPSFLRKQQTTLQKYTRGGGNSVIRLFCFCHCFSSKWGRRERKAVIMRQNFGNGKKLQAIGRVFGAPFAIPKKGSL